MRFLLGRRRGIAAVLIAVAVTGIAAISASAKSSHRAKPLSRALKAALSKNANQHVIVILKGQMRQAHVGSRSAAVRMAQIRASQAPVMAQLRSVHATHVKSYQLINAVSATVSKAERAQLSRNASVAEVIPDTTVRLASPTLPTASAAKAKHSSSTAGVTPNNIPGACGANGKVQLDPEGLASTNTDSDDPSQPTARSLGFTGAGVKVGYIAEGIDTQNVNFIRPDGKSVFDPSIGGDYEDFSGDGPNAVTSGGEAFLDANAIAGQGIHVYNVANFSAQPQSQPCNIRIEGVAPGVALVGLKVFAENAITTESDFLEAINYAVETAHVNVLNESFGSNPFPDETALDVAKQFDDAATAAGVTVTSSTGDAGPFDTIGSPATDPDVISAGASTNFRFYAQTNYALARDFATTGWLNNNISSLSSAGFDQDGATVDLVAPGDGSFASCTASPTYQDCTNFTGAPSDVERSGGTSQSSPFVAGAAALVIQAYRQSHGGQSPAPALVKQILVSTASDLGSPADEEGSGLLNSYKAVKLAESIGNPHPTSAALTESPTQLNAVGAPGQTQRFQFTLSNPGNTTQTLNLSGRTFGPAENVQTGSVTLNDSTSPHVTDFAGTPDNYQVFHFHVGAGADRLLAQLAWPVDQSNCNVNFCQTGLNSRVRMILVDPQGRFAGHSLPQGPASYGETEVESPAPGTWTGVIFGNVAAAGGTNGVVPWEVSTQRHVPFGSVSPSSVTLAPGQSRTVNVAAQDPSAPGDTSGSVVINPTNGSGATSVPVTLRSLVEPRFGGRFSGNFTGGNGRPNGQGQEEYYEFDVPRGVNDIRADLSFAQDPSDPVAEYLVSPDGDTVGYAQNNVEGNQSTALSAYTTNPDPGRWTLIVVFAGAEPGDVISQPYQGQIQFNSARVRGIGVPDGGKLAAGQAVTVPVKITNTGVAPEDYFVDPRLNTTENITLAQLGQGTVDLPMTYDNTTYEPEWLVPTQTSAVRVAQTSSLPAMFDFTLAAGDPLLASASFGPGSLCQTSSSLLYDPPGGTVTAGIYFGEPTECGPFAGPAPAGTATIAAAAQTKAFDSTVTSSTGDFWLFSVDTTGSFSPITIQPGHSAEVSVTFTPTGAKGTKVRGNLYVDTLTDKIPPYNQESASEVTAIPYKYTIGRKRR
ncbi:MAG TPA: S8 family serine peptidase [Solirubrobacteraceae bacterium]|nr:S8 family serine peptidase [Solirubrobacteraceae bacterium]